MLDEAAANTPWGGSGVWAQLSLAALFHNDMKGGEKVFQLMARFAEKPRENLDVLELVYCALALGFEGRYRVADNGRAQLEAVRDRLAQVVRRERGDHPRALAQHWQGQPVRRGSALNWLPLAGTAAGALLLLVGAYMAFALSLASRSDPVFGQIQGLRLTPPVVAAPLPAARPRLAQFLQSDLKANLVAVRDEVDRSVVTLRGDGSFAPGSATLLSDREALMTRIADALAQVSGSVLVTGHTDNQPIARSARFPSNWHLSEERARTVRDLLVARKVAPERIRAEGRAEAEPLVANDTPGNRALNRRVEITLVVGRDGSVPTPPAK
jgi:type VI secretion system protein ImpK